jgi:ABC-type antimicrobial peptide transport system permease subunit
MFQTGRMYNQFAIHTSVSPMSIAGQARRAAQDVVKSALVDKLTTLSDQVDAAIVPERLLATLSEFFGALGALLAGVGLYGLLAYSVARRVNEIGVRMALGATSGGVLRLVMGDALGMVAAGFIVGTVLVLWSRPMAALLVQDLKIDSPAPVVCGGMVVCAVAMLASYVPARRAARVDPMAALRQE